MKRITSKIEENTDPIDALVSGIDVSSCENTCGSIFINEVKNEILDLNRAISIPRIPVSRICYSTIAPSVGELCSIIPEYLAGHALLSQQKPPSESHFLHFVKLIKGVKRDFIHILKLDFRFTSEMGTNYHDGTADFYPSYKVDKMPYRSFLVPVESVESSNGRVSDFNAPHILKKEDVEGDFHFMTHAIFDEFDPTELNDKIADFANRDIFPFSLRMYQIVAYGYFSVCMSIPHPTADQITEAVKVFEPIAEKIVSSFGDVNGRIAAAESYSDALVMSDNILSYTEQFNAVAKNYFSRYSLFQDDELALKRWRRLDVAR